MSSNQHQCEGALLFDEATTAGIARELLACMQDLWRRKRQTEITLPEPLAVSLARSAHRRNEQASGREGGRIVGKLIADHIESAIQHAATTAPDRYLTSHRIVLSLVDDTPTSTSGEPTDANAIASIEHGEIIVTCERAGANVCTRISAGPLTQMTASLPACALCGMPDT